ncbi:deoxyribonuclease IV [uncultured Cetobacterium sp.]|uniref:deoxyribonuclease IV n=1 Tax=uncultured Cetobacterium sp. TaxID=527638 RepID=UPI00261C52AA|nr:deoxyribonuclease IV [uncultured Cetobacterium sp.]
MTREDKIKNTYLGAHVSIQGGVSNVFKNAVAIGANGFGMFLKNQRRWDAKPYTEDDILEFKDCMKRYKFKPEQILPHDGYLINLGSPDDEKREKSLNAFIDEMERVNQLGLIYLNTHPGSHLKEISEDRCVELIADSINRAHKIVPNIVVVLENTAGQGSNMGYKFEHLRDIIDLIEDKKRIAVCLDTCHTVAAGYPLSTEEEYNQTMNSFEEIVGFKYLKGIHLNDSMFGVGSKKDRHHSIGEGTLGMDFFKRFMNDERFRQIPIVMETIDETIWKDEIELLINLID